MDMTGVDRLTLGTLLACFSNVFLDTVTVFPKHFLIYLIYLQTLRSTKDQTTKSNVI